MQKQMETLMPRLHITCIKLPHSCSSHGHITNLSTRAWPHRVPRIASCLSETALNQKVITGDGKCEAASRALSLMTDNDGEIFSMLHTMFHLLNCPCGLRKCLTVKLSFTYTIHTIALSPPK